MLRLPPFELRRVATVGEAAAVLAGEGPRARLVAGGTDLYPNLKRRHQKAEVIVPLSGLAELSGIADGNGSGMRLGATTTLAEVAAHPLLRRRYPALARAVLSISSPPLRNMGTIGGNVLIDTRCTYYNQTEEWRRAIDYCMKEEGTICWVAPSSPRCWAHAASDSAPMLAALGAEVELRSARGRRTLPVAELYRDDGIDYLGKAPDELLAAVGLPGTADADHCRSAFWKLRRRGSIDFAVLSAAVALWLDGEVVRRAEIWLGAVASQPCRAEATAAALVGQRLEPAVIAAAAALAPGSATPMDNTDFQAQWRKAMVRRYVEAALRDAAGLPQERLAPHHLAV